MLAPFPYFGGKARLARAIWDRLGDVPNYVEPFVGSAAVLLARPDSHSWPERVETINDTDGMVANLWRAIQSDPDAVARWADWPANENDLHARHAWLVARRGSLSERLEGDPEYHDAQIAGWWLWGICLWIGSGWCSGDGPWQVREGKLVHLGDAGRGVNRQLVHLGDAGRGVNRQLVHLGDAGQGINRQLVHLGDAGQGMCGQWAEHTRGMMRTLQDRLRRVRVCSGDWSRVCGPTPTYKLGLTGVFLDPPYPSLDRAEVYTEDSRTVAAKAVAWCRGNGDNPLLRIALCGYGGNYDLPGWSQWQWRPRGGYGSQGEGRGRANRRRETVWFSPHCLKPDLFAWWSTQEEQE